MIDRLIELQPPPDMDTTLFEVYKDQLIEDSIEYSYNLKFSTCSTCQSPGLTARNASNVNIRSHCK